MDQDLKELRTKLRPPSKAPWVLLALALVVAGVLVATRLLERQAPPTVAAPAAAPAAATAPAPPPGPPPTVDPARLRSLLETASAHPLFRRWLGEGDLLRRWVVVTDNLAEGVSPRAHLDFLAPARPFSVVTRGKKTAISPRSYARYDGFADAVASVDAPALARVYRELYPALEAAYRALGYPDASLDRVTSRALQRIEVVPVRDGEVAVEERGAIYAFADPRLEQLRPVEKHLLRMGPRNARLIQAKARDIRQALGLPYPEAGGPGR
jgi:hypothetical protein